MTLTARSTAHQFACLAAALLFTALSSLAVAEELLTIKEFYKVFVDAVLKADPTITIRKTDDEGFVAKHADGTESQVYIGNSYRQYREAPDTRDAVIERHVRVLLQSAGAEDDVELSANMIVPVVRHMSYLNEILRGSKDGKKPELVFDQLTPELVVVYVFDFPDRIMVMRKEHLGEANVERSRLRTLASANLKRLYGQNLQVKGGKGFYYFEAGSVFDSSMLLLDIWNKRNFPVKGDIVAFVPARNYLMVTGSDDAEGLALARKVSSQVVANEAYALTEKGLVWRDGKWLAFKK